VIGAVLPKGFNFFLFSIKKSNVHFFIGDAKLKNRRKYEKTE